MKKRIAVFSLAVCLLLSGCASLLERSYSVVEPYADRYWDASAEDTLRAENYQDLVNSLLMLVEERAEDGVIRYYTDGNAYSLAKQATSEVQEETMLGSYLLEDISFLYKASDGFCTLTYTMTYRQDAEDVESLMVLSDSQSLVDLLRLAIREGHNKLTARFAYDMPREDVEAAVESVWREVCMGAETTDPSLGELDGELLTPPVPQLPAESGGDGAEDTADVPAEAAVETESPDETAGEIPPCPWEIRYYPDLEAAELVEVLLKS